LHHSQVPLLLHKNGGEPPLKQMPHPPVAAVEHLPVDPVELPHSTRQIGLGRLNQQMIVFDHQTIGMAEPTEATNHLAEGAQPGLTTRIGPDGAVLRIPAAGEMVDRVGEFNPEWASHGGTVYR